MDSKKWYHIPWLYRPLKISEFKDKIVLKSYVFLIMKPRNHEAFINID